MAPGSGSETLVLPRTFCFVPVILLIAQNLARYAANAASSRLATRASGTSAATTTAATILTNRQTKLKNIYYCGRSTFSHMQTNRQTAAASCEINSPWLVRQKIKAPAQTHTHTHTTVVYLTRVCACVSVRAKKLPSRTSLRVVGAHWSQCDQHQQQQQRVVSVRSAFDDCLGFL